jgi:hypothetical protein
MRANRATRPYCEGSYILDELKDCFGGGWGRVDVVRSNCRNEISELPGYPLSSLTM